MKQKSKISQTSSILSILGLVLLLLISPCKVRNFAQAELGIPQTKVYNKSKATVSLSNCQVLENTEAVQSYSPPTVKPPLFPFTGGLCEAVVRYFSQHSFDPGTSMDRMGSPVPLYILYRNLRVYS